MYLVITDTCGIMKTLQKRTKMVNETQQQKHNKFKWRQFVGHGQAAASPRCEHSDAKSVEWQLIQF